ncbi:MAG: TlpA family protein disulfide reductase [Bacteroidales bacterium]|jgi:thiol-disulfide isomerase/thioredoxin|nr:TlpA family protein disulfide reductase [Bacteroidales bacterium]
MKKIIFLFLILAGILSCERKSTLQSGIWRGELSVAGNKQAPFLFEVNNDGADTASVTLINGEERVVLSGVTLQGDSVVIPIVAYDAVIKGVATDDAIEGRFIKNYIENDQGVPFTARHGQGARFAPAENPTGIAIDGKWEVHFIGEKGDTTHNVGIFQSDDQIVTGSILTNSGDLRFLEGAYTQDGVQLSAFGGLSPYLVEITFTDNNHFTGIFYTTRGTTQLSGSRNDEAALADPYSLAGLKPGYETLGFSLPDTEGNIVSLSDERFRDKVVIVSILGSWCPNCLDEMAFLAPWYEENRERGLEVIGIAFERKDDFDYAKRAITQLKERYNTGYPILFGGEVGRESIAGALPELDNFSSYPTTIFIDRQGKVRRIHTGFNGPATGLFYQEFIEDFNTLVDSLLTADY